MAIYIQKKYTIFSQEMADLSSCKCALLLPQRLKLKNSISVLGEQMFQLPDLELQPTICAPTNLKHSVNAYYGVTHLISIPWELTVVKTPKKTAKTSCTCQNL